MNVPLTTYPSPAAWVFQFLPLTHGLLAIRDVFNGNLASAAWQALIEAAVAACWLALCPATFRWFVLRGRRNGSLEYAS